MENTKAEIAFLEMQKKSILKKKKGAGADDMMPPAIAKKQRALLKKMDLEKVSCIDKKNPCERVGTLLPAIRF